MSHLKNPKPLALPALTGDMITPMMEEFLLSFSLDQIMDLAMGKPDCDTKSSLKDLLLKLLDKCYTFILCNIPKQDIRSQDVDTILGNALLTSFSDIFSITGKIHPMSFDIFNELFIKYVKESLSSVCSTHDPDTSVVCHLSWSEAVDSIFPHALQLTEELLLIYLEENIETEPEFAKYLQRRKENQESDLEMVNEFILEELSKTTNERESDLKMVEEFISQEFSDPSLEISDDSLDALPPADNQGTRDEEASVVLSEEAPTENPGSRDEEASVVLSEEAPTENPGSRDEEASVVPLPIAQQQNEAAGVETKNHLQNDGKDQCKGVSPAPGHKETRVSSVENVVSTEQHLSEESTLSKGRQLVDAELESVVTTELEEPLPVTSDAEKEEQQSSIMLLVNTIVTKALTKSRITCKYKHLQKITERLSEKIWAEVKEQELKIIQSKLDSLSKDILREVTKKIGCSRKDIFLLLGLNNSVVDETLISICKEKMVKKAKKPNLIKRFWTSIGKTFKSL